MKQPIKVAVSIENVFSIYRNFSFFNKKTKVISCIRVFLEILLMFASIYFYFIFDLKGDAIYFLVTPFYSIVIMIKAVYRSKEFKEMIMGINACSEYFAEIAGKTAMKSRKRILICVLIWYNAGGLARHTYYGFLHEASTSAPTAVKVFSYCLFYMYDFRFVLEFTVLWSVLISIADQINNIALSVEEEITKIRQNNYISVYGNSEACDKWSVAYTKIDNVSHLCNSLFKTQATAMISIVVYNFIKVAFVAISSNLSLKQVIHAEAILQYFVALLMVSYSAQKVRNNEGRLKQLLARLLLVQLDDLYQLDSQYKSTRNLLRVVKSHPIHMKAFGRVMGMPLIPACIAFWISNLVVICSLTISYKSKKA